MACNPTVQYNEFTGNGSTTAYTFTFPYDNTADVQVRLGTYPNYTYPSYTTEYSVDSANPTIVNFVTAPSGPIRIFRCTPNTNLPATFQPGSAIRSSDLNNNFNQILYVSQDSSIRSVDAQAVADAAYNQSNTAITTAGSAVTTANSAVTTANGAVTTANSAVSTANAAQSAVASAVLYEPVANVGSIPGSPSNGDYVEVLNSTGIESFSPLSSLPSGFVGDSGLSVRLKYVVNTWVFQNYYANDVNDRFIKKSGDTFTGLVTLSGAPTSNLHAATKAYVDASSGVALPLAGGTMTGLLTLSGAPTANLHAATKQYVDSNAILVADGGNFDSGASLVSTSSTFDGGSF